MFQAVTDDHTPTLINEDAIRQERGWVKSLAEALSQIEYPWNCFYPCEMFSEFAAEILRLKLERDATGYFHERVMHEWARCVANALNPQNPQNRIVEQGNFDLNELDFEDDSDNRIDMRTLRVIGTISGGSSVIWATTGREPYGKALIKDVGTRPTRAEMENAVSRGGVIAQLDMDEWIWKPQKAGKPAWFKK